MEIRRAISSGTLCSVTNGLVFCAMFTLPWINSIRVATGLFFATIVVSLLYQARSLDFSWYRKQLPFWLLGIYYVLQLIGVFVFPERSYTLADAEQKASLIVVPLSLFILVYNNNGAWQNGIRGFIYGNAFAAAWCFIVACHQYLLHRDSSVFFYHQYSLPLKLSAIYFSLYILVALGYILLSPGEKNKRQAYVMRGIALFLFLNLLLLSSKMMIAMGVILLAAFIARLIQNKALKIAALSIIGSACIILAITINPIKERYADVRLDTYSSVLNKREFKDYVFDGLSIRLLLWRLGNEIINERGTWISGTGGKRYHEFLNPKMLQYQMYAGDGASSDHGFLDYNMHNQYMESYLQFGVAGVVLLASLLSYTLWHAILNQHAILVYTLILFSVAFLTESLLETQVGVILFTIIISGEWVQLQKAKSGLANSR